MILALSVSTLVACGGSAAQSGGATTPPTGGKTEIVSGDPNERCAVLRSCFGEASEFEGCPDPVAVFASASTEINVQAKNLLTRLIAELKQVDRIAKLRLTGYGLPTEPPYVAEARVNAVKDWLVANGVKASLIDTDFTKSNANTGYVSFAPRQCTGKRDTEDETTPAVLFLVL